MCRSFLDKWTDEDGNEVHDGRNNLGVVSINLPRVALDAGGDLQVFWELLDERLELCKEALFTRIQRFEGVTAEVAPILYMEGACGHRLKKDEEIMNLFKDGRASISLGYIGVNEMVNVLVNNDKHMFDSDCKKALGISVIAYMKRKVVEWRKESGFGFSLYSTPSESLCDRFCRLDTKIYGYIKDVTDHSYYTNSFHLDVRKKVSPNQKIDFEAPYPKYASGGFITFTELPDMKRNLKALEWVWDYSYDKVPYLGINTPVDYCGECGFSGESVPTENGFSCPCCSNHNPETLQVTRRVCGYLGSPDTRPFIEGKQREVMSRVKHYPDI